jgi:hypothetical protein
MTAVARLYGWSAGTEDGTEKTHRSANSGQNFGRLEARPSAADAIDIFYQGGLAARHGVEFDPFLPSFL